MDKETYCRHLNNTRYAGNPSGFYESFFQRANHPTRPLAFWVRYTIFSPKGHPEEARGELWAIYFDGETGRHVALKRDMLFRDCRFDRSAFAVEIGEARLGAGRMHGRIGGAEGSIAWDLRFNSRERPLLFMPFWTYQSRFPPAKGLVGMLLARFSGTISVHGTTVDVRDWVGSQNHNWGVKHTDHYAWAQVAGFDTHPESFLEMISARIKIGGMWIPMMTSAVLRHEGEEHAFNGLFQVLGSRTSLEGSDNAWVLTFKSKRRHLTLTGTVSAPKRHFVGLVYSNPPGGIKYCLNSKIASCTLVLTDARAKRSETLSTAHRAAFEIITDDPAHGVRMYV